MNKLLNKYNNTYHHSIVKKSVDVGYSALTEEIKTNPKSSKLNVVDRMRITKNKNNFSKVYTENWLKEVSVIDYVLKTNPWTYKIKDFI